MALDGEVMLIGASNVDAQNVEAAGASFVFRFDGSTWLQEQKLISPDPEQFADFGWSVAIDGSTALIGAFGENDGVGAAHVFSFDGSAWEASAE